MKSVQPKIIYTSCADEEFLLAEVEVDDVMCCQVLKREADGPVMLAFFRPETREEVLVDPDAFLAAVSTAVKEIRAVKG